MYIMFHKEDHSMKLIPILLVLSSCAFGADKAQDKIREIASIQDEYAFDLKSHHATYMTEVKKLEAKIIKKMEDKMKSIASTDLDKAILIKAEIEKVKNGSMRREIIAAFTGEKETDLLGNDVEKKVEGANDNVLNVVCGKWKHPNGNIFVIKNNGQCIGKDKSEATWKFEDNKLIVTWPSGTVATWNFINKDTVSVTNSKGETFTLTRVIESK